MEVTGGKLGAVVGGNRGSFGVRNIQALLHNAFAHAGCPPRQGRPALSDLVANAGHTPHSISERAKRFETSSDNQIDSRKERIVARKNWRIGHRLGEASRHVRLSQVCLGRLGLLKGGADGTFDLRTRRASRRFEQRFGGPKNRFGSNGAVDRRQLLAMERQVELRRNPGARAFALARTFLGKSAGTLKTRGPLAALMPNWVPNNLNCANFVSAVLVKAGALPRRAQTAAVAALDDTLVRSKNWRTVSLRNAKPGDVVIMGRGGGSRGHVVFFAGFKNGRPYILGSNNPAPGAGQVVSMKPLNLSRLTRIHQPR